MVVSIYFCSYIATWSRDDRGGWTHSQVGMNVEAQGLDNQLGRYAKVSLVVSFFCSCLAKLLIVSFVCSSMLSSAPSRIGSKPCRRMRRSGRPSTISRLRRRFKPCSVSSRWRRKRIMCVGACQELRSYVVQELHPCCGYSGKSNPPCSFWGKYRVCITKS